MGLLLLMGGVSDPNPQSLFANNEAGLALDVETAYRRGWIFQDSAGATVSAAAGDPVGLILDTAKGGLNSLGSDLVSNGTFATDTVWSKGANWTIGSGVATKTGGAANNLTQTITSTAGLWYRITMDVTRSAGTLTVSLGTSGTTYAITATGTYTFFILAGSSTQTLTLAGDSAFAGTVDNVTTRLVPGNHAYQTTSGSRPLLARTPDGGRRNLLTYSEQFDNAAWTTGAASVSQNTSATTDPVGTNTADKLIENTANTRHEIYRTNTLTAENYTFSIYLKAAERNRAALSLATAGNTVGAVFDLTSSGSVVATDAGASAAISSVGSGWYRCSVTVLGTAAAYFPAVRLVSSGTTQLYTGDGTSGVYLWGAQLETGSSATTYQKVGLTSDVTESGKRDCWGLLFDGSDDSLQTASVNFSATDEMTVMVGVRKLSDGSYPIIAELSTNWTSNNGSFSLSGNLNNGYAWSSRGTGWATVLTTDYLAPVTTVLGLQSDVSGPSLVLRANGSEINTSSSSQGLGNYGTWPIYISSRAGSSNYFNGLIYTLIVRGATTPTQTIKNFERNLLALRCGVTF